MAAAHLDREVAPQVFETVYANGEATLCNYNEREVECAGRRIPALGYVLVKGNAK